MKRLRRSTFLVPGNVAEFIDKSRAIAADVLLFDQPFMALDRPSEQAIVACWADLTASTPRAVVVADYLPPPGVDLSGQIDLDRWSA